MLPFDDTGSLATRRYLVKVTGFRVADSGPLCDLIYAPIPAAVAVTTASRSQRRCLGGEDAEEEGEEDEMT